MRVAYLRVVENPMLDDKSVSWLLPQLKNDGSWDGESFWLKGNTKESAEAMMAEMAGEVPTTMLHSEEAKSAAAKGTLIAVERVGTSTARPWSGTYKQLELDFG